MMLASATMVVLAAAGVGAVMKDDAPPMAGRGCGVRAPQRQRAGRDVYGQLRIFPNDFFRETAMTVQQFDALLLEVGADIAAPRNPHRASRRRPAKLSVANRLLMVLLWLRSYHRYRSLAVWSAVCVRRDRLLSIACRRVCARRVVASHARTLTLA
jgi:hypothetical protein